MATDYSLDTCSVCGASFFIDSNGNPLHVDDDGDIDYAVDADHFAQ
ncbi:MAG: hypothetical protein WAV90_04030 [Gordonia amarae]